MKTTRLDSLCAALIAAFIGCLAQPAHADGVKSAIEAADAQFSAIAAKGDGAPGWRRCTQPMGSCCRPAAT